LDVAAFVAEFDVQASAFAVKQHMAEAARFKALLDEIQKGFVGDREGFFPFVTASDFDPFEQRFVVHFMYPPVL
jgi:hypothetical protein